MPFQRPLRSRTRPESASCISLTAARAPAWMRVVRGRRRRCRRLPRTTRIQAGARAAVKLMHEADSGRVRDRNGRWKGMARIDPLAQTSWGLAWDYNVVKAVEGPPGEVLNVTGLREGKQLHRPEGQRAFNLWKYAFRPDDVARGHDGLREAYDRFLIGNFPLP